MRIKPFKILLILLILFLSLQSWPHPRLGEGKRACLLFGYNAARYNGDLTKQTKSRCDKAIEVYCDDMIHKIYVTTAGIGHHVSVGEEMMGYLSTHGVDERDIIIYMGGYNTAGEIDSFLEIAPRNCMVFGISSKYHLFRIRLLFRSRGIICRTFGSNGGVPKVEKRIEVFKNIVTLFVPHMLAEKK